MGEKSAEIRSKVIIYFKNKWLHVTTLLVFTLLLVTPIAEKFSFVPDFLKLSNVKSKDFFSLIIGAIASIFGILMAVVLLTVEVFKEKLNNKKHTNPLENGLIRNSIYNSVNLIGLSFISYILFDEFSTPKSLTVGYLVGAIFIVYVYSVYPVLKKIISKTSQIKTNIDLAESLNFDDFKKVSKYRYTEKYEHSKLKEIKREIDLYILENKIKSYENISERILEKSIELIGDGYDREKCDIILGALTWIWRENCKTAIRVSDSSYFDYVWNMIEKLYLYAALKKIQLLHFYEIESFIYFDLKSLYKVFKNTISLTTGLDAVESSFSANVKFNAPPQGEIWELVHRYEGIMAGQIIDSSLQWDHIDHVLDFIFDIQDIAILLRDKNLFENCNNRINNICYDIAFKFENLGKYQKGDLIWKALTTNYYKSSEALKHDIYDSTKSCYKIHNHLIKRLIKEETIDERDLRVIIRTIGNDIFKALCNHKLDTNYNFSTLTDFCSIGVHSLKNYTKNKIDKNVVDFFYRFLKKLKKYIEKEEIEKFGFEYQNLKRAVNHFITVRNRLEEEKEPNESLKNWDKLFNDFKDVKLTNDFLRIKWKIEKPSTDE